MTEFFGIVCTVIAVGGVVLNNRKVAACFWLWMVSNAISAGVHISLGCWSLAARDAIFFVLAIEGIWLWRKNVARGHRGHGERSQEFEKK